MKTIKTRTGKTFDFTDILQNQISIIDIAWSLAHQCRFNGHTERFYSVAEHSVLVSRLCYSPWRIYGLLHDAHEAYIGDIVGPLKELLSDESGIIDDLRKIELDIDTAIFSEFDLDVQKYYMNMKDNIKNADILMLKYEQFHLMGEDSLSKLDNVDFSFIDYSIGLDPEKAYEKFLHYFTKYLPGYEIK